MITRESFDGIVQQALSKRKPGEHFFLSLSGEDSQFIRLNAAKVRQIGTIEDASLQITLVLENKEGLRRASASCTLSGLSWKDQEELDACIGKLRREVPELPLDPYASLPVNHGSSEQVSRGQPLPHDRAVDAILSSVPGLDFAGVYAGGRVIRAMANSAGQSAWFSSEDFKFDYSLYTKSQRALKGTLAGKAWEQKRFETEMSDAKKRLEVMERTPRKIPRGEYRTYLAPAAMKEFTHMLSWACIGEASIRQGESPLRHVRSGAKRFSPHFSFSEDFSGGETPRFNSLGEIAPERLELISKGDLKATLVSTRTFKEYGVPSNGAVDREEMRAPAVGAGSLSNDGILTKLGTGLYLSNLHYLNWSDHKNGRVTGMTRYACFWVENGEIIAPIENMRWDDSIFSVLGENLEALTAQRSYEPVTDTYFGRQLGGAWMPGALLSKMNFTL